jgi:hypothetical protein
MTTEGGRKTGKESRGTRGEREAARRAERSRAALRENLKRRKAQARARRQGDEQPHDSAGIAPDKPKV